MTIDDTIREHKECAREQRKRASEPYELYPNLCRKRAEEHEQYIEWLEELKELRELKDTYAKGMETSYSEFRYKQGRQDESEEWECAVADKIIKHDEDIYKALPEVIEKVRNDAIDEFIKGCKATHDGLICNWDKPYGITFERMEEKAKELKESKE